MGANMTLSDGEKLILAMLCDIQKALGVRGAIDPDTLSAALLGGADVELDLNGATGGRQAGERVAAEVGDILDMWSAIERAYKHLTLDQKREVEAGAGPLGRGVRFSGFDGDSEMQYRQAAQTLIDSVERFERFQGRNLEATMPALMGYRRMLRLFAPMRPSLGDSRLGVYQIIALANAEKYAG
jgi:uncharacterized protein